MSVEKASKLQAPDVERLRGWAEERGLPEQPEATDLVCVSHDALGRPQKLTRRCAERWEQMRGAAEASGVELLLVSGFRSVEHQRGIFARKLERGERLEDILCVNAPPGFSEHHSGRALDLGTPGCDELSEDFEATPAFEWLCESASRFGFVLSYPRDNSWGFDYEPWHWALREEEAS